jgi:hypothetical protein
MIFSGVHSHVFLRPCPHPSLPRKRGRFGEGLSAPKGGEELFVLS